MATIQDVADAAGVSIATVSRSMNGHTRVSEATRERVLAAARALDFIPSRAARGLVTGKLGNVGILLPDISNPFFATIVAGVEQIAQRDNIGVFLADSQERVDAEPQLVRGLAEQVDGVILVAPRMADEEVKRAGGRVPVVMVNRVVEGFDGVAVDAVQGMHELIVHVAAAGHKKIGYVDGPSASWSGRAKIQGLQLGAAKLGIELKMLGQCAPTYAAGREYAPQLLDTDVTAVIAFDDMIAWGIVTRLQELGMDIPRDLSIAGFDDSIEEGMLRPSLTTVSPQGASMGAIGAQLLLDRLKDTDADTRVEMLRCTVLERESVVGPKL